MHNDRGPISQLMDVIAHVLTCSTSCFHPSCTQSWYLDLGTRWFYWVPVPLPVPLQATDFAAKECTEGRSAIDGSLNALKGRQMRRTVRTCSIGKDQRCPKNGGIKHWIKGPIFWTLMGHMMVDPMSFFMYPCCWTNLKRYRLKSKTHFGPQIDWSCFVVIQWSQLGVKQCIYIY